MKRKELFFAMLILVLFGSVFYITGFIQGQEQSREMNVLLVDTLMNCIENYGGCIEDKFTWILNDYNNSIYGGKE